MSKFTPSAQAYSRPELCKRYGKKATRTIKRWEQSGVLPKPDFFIKDRPYWWPETIHENERRSLADKF
jgi:hypothetical protein